MNIGRKINSFFYKETSIAPLIIFRIIFGALMLFGALRFVAKGWVETLYINPTFHFKYLGFEWVDVLSGNWMYLPFILMILSAIGILLGYKYRLSAILFFLSFSYVELLDKTYYLNHYYFVSLIAFLMIFLPANRSFSLDVRLNPGLKKDFIPFWTIFIIQFQLGIVYFFAGLAKLNSDWLFEAQPLKIWLQAYRDLPMIGWLFASSVLAFVFSWFGIIYDLTIPFFLSNSKTRNIAYVFVIVFHLVTWILFPIGVFPWVMIFSTLIFFPANFHLKLLNRISKVKIQNLRIENQILSGASSGNKLITAFLISYIVFQLVIPLRSFLYPGNLFWNEEGFRFSWRVMLMHKEGNTTFYVKDRKSGGEIEIQNCDYLTASQIDQMATQPDFILQFSKFLKTKFNDTLLVYGDQKVHLKNPLILAESFVSLNGRPHKLFIAKKHDISSFTYNLKHRTWVEEF